MPPLSSVPSSPSVHNSLFLYLCSMNDKNDDDGDDDNADDDGDDDGAADDDNVTKCM